MGEKLLKDEAWRVKRRASSNRMMDTDDRPGQDVNGHSYCPVDASILWGIPSLLHFDGYPAGFVLSRTRLVRVMFVVHLACTNGRSDCHLNKLTNRDRLQDVGQEAPKGDSRIWGVRLSTNGAPDGDVQRVRPSGRRTKVVRQEAGWLYHF